MLQVVTADYALKAGAWPARREFAAGVAARTRDAMRRGGASVVYQAAQRMPPVDVMVGIRLCALPVLLDDFVGKQEDHQHERDHQKCAQYHVFGHDKLPVVKRLQMYCSPRATDCIVGKHLLRSAVLHRRAAVDSASTVPASRRPRRSGARPAQRDAAPYHERHAGALGDAPRGNEERKNLR